MAVADDGFDGGGGGAGDGGADGDLVVFLGVEELESERVVELLLEADGRLGEQSGEVREGVEEGGVARVAGVGGGQGGELGADVGALGF